MIRMEIITESLFKIPYLGIRKKKIYVTGEKYSLRAKIENRSQNLFQGGTFQINIHWPNGLVVRWPFTIGQLAPGGIHIENYGNTDVLDESPALFLVNGIDNNGQAILFCDGGGNQLTPQPTGFVHLHTIIPKNAEALYQLWALVIAVISLFPILIKDVILPLGEWLLSQLDKVLSIL